jgi:hypothetical protein
VTVMLNKVVSLVVLEEGVVLEALLEGGVDGIGGVG